MWARGSPAKHRGWSQQEPSSCWLLCPGGPCDQPGGRPEPNASEASAQAACRQGNQPRPLIKREGVESRPGGVRQVRCERGVPTPGLPPRVVKTLARTTSDDDLDPAVANNYLRSMLREFHPAALRRLAPIKPTAGADGARDRPDSRPAHGLMPVERVPRPQGIFTGSVRRPSRGERRLGLPRKDGAEGSQEEP